MKAYTSRARFDESRNFSGVYQQMGRVSLDSDWNEEVRIRTTDARRRTHDLATGSPDEGYLISDQHLIDPITSLQGWAGSGLEPGDLRVIPPVLRLDRKEPEGLPYVIRAQGHVRLERTFSTTKNLTELSYDPARSFAAAALVFSVRFERPANDDELTDVTFFVADADGQIAEIPASFEEDLPEAWTEQIVPVAALAGLDATRIRSWGVRGLSPRAHTWLGALRATDAALGADGTDFVIRGGDGSIRGAGRMLLDGVRAYLTTDVRYSSQPDLADPPPLAALPADGSAAHVVYLDVWETLVTALDDSFLEEPALDGLDTTVRLRTLCQIKVQQSTDPSANVELPLATGAGRLSTNVPPGVFPDRYPAEPEDPCRDRCLFTESASTVSDYTGAHNLHCRVEILFAAGPQPVFTWSRDNGSTRLPLVADAPATATSLQLSGEDAQRLRAGDVVVISDRRIDQLPQGARQPVLRVVKASDPATGSVMFHESFALATTPTVLEAGGALGVAFTLDDRPYVRRWDGADWLLTDVRYNLPEGLSIRFSGDDFRPAEYWSFTARIENSDAASRGRVEDLQQAPVHGPIHYTVPLARVTRSAEALQFEDLRPRYLPLAQVRDRLIELAEARVPTGAFTLIVGDGVRTFGDIDQDLLEGVTADEALQSAVNTLKSAGGGTLYIRAGDYRLEKPVLLSGCSRLRILGDGDASALRVVGAGGAFLLDDCGAEGEVGLELLSLVEAPLEDSVIGIDAEALPPPGEDVEPFAPGDLVRSTPAADTFLDTVAASSLDPNRLGKRALNSVRATLDELRRLQRSNPGVAVEDLPAAAPLLAALRLLPHGVVTIGDSQRVTLRRLRIESREPQAEAAGLFITGTCSELSVSECRITAAAAIVAAPYAPYLSRSFLARNVRSGLSLHAVALEGNRLSPLGSAVHGVYLADGNFDGVEVSENEVSGFALGVVIKARADQAGALERVALKHNRITDFGGLGIDIVGRGVDVIGNVVTAGTPLGFTQSGIRIRGSGVRVRQCDVTLPATLENPTPLAAIAGIVVGSGVDSGSNADTRTFTAVQDVEVSGCRLRGAASYAGVGVLIGGPEPKLDVRVSDSHFRNFGDAALRVWGHGGKVGRLSVRNNRIEDTALGNVPARADCRDVLEAMAPSATNDLLAAGVDFADPRALLNELVGSASDDALAAIDAVLRWLSQRTLRAAIALDQVLDAELCDNRIDGVGRDGATVGDDVYTAALGLVGCTDLLVDGNSVENVVAEVTGTEGGPAPLPPRGPLGFDTLSELEVVVDTHQPGRKDTHAAAAMLRRLLLQYARGDDATRQQLGRRIYAAMDALVADLDEFGGAGSKIAAALALEADEMRTAQGRADHTKAANRVRASLSRGAAFTAEGDVPEEAWDAATEFDLAIVANNVTPAAEKLQDAADALTEGLPDQRAALETAMARVLGAPANMELQFEAAALLGTLGETRDAEQARKAQTPGRAVGSKGTVVVRFADRLREEADRLSTDTGTANRTLLETLAKDKQVLVDSLRGVNDTLADTLEGDWRSIERSVTADRKERLLATLAQAKSWAETGSVDAAPSAADAARTEETGTAALTAMVARHLDSNIALLATESEGAKTKSLRVLQLAAGQLRQLVDTDRGAETLADEASAAIAAAAADPKARSTELARARTALDAIRRRAEGILPATPPVFVPPPVTNDLDRRTAALGAAALAFRSFSPTEAASKAPLFRDHFVRALDLAKVTDAVRNGTLSALDAALKLLTANSTSAARAGAVQTLVRELDRLLQALPSTTNDSTVDTVAALVQAALIGLGTADDEATRLLRVQAHLRTSVALSSSVRDQLLAHADLDGLVLGLAGVLDRLGRGERPTVPAVPAPEFGRRLAPADCVFAARWSGRGRISNNQLHHAVRGVTVLGDRAHPLVGAVQNPPGLVLQIDNNRVDGCALGGFELRPDGDATLNVANNELFACVGVGEATPGHRGQAVVAVRGSGQLTVSGNCLHANGHEHPHALVNEVALDWEGEVVVRGNTIRHTGGGAGGAGLLVRCEPIADDLSRRLVSSPFLAIEPPPAPRPLPMGPIAKPTLADTLSAGVLGTFSTLAKSAAVTAVDEARTGRLLQTIPATRVAPRLLTAPAPVRTSGIAQATANRYLSRAVASPLREIADFVRPGVYWRPSPPPPPPGQRSFHIEGNDIAARGPALLVAAIQDGDLVASSIVGNALTSEGSTGAVYVRYADSLLFTGNRCQAPDAINVVVIRALEAAISVTGNVILGREPVAPVRPPIIAKPPRPGAITGASVSLGLGNGAEIHLPIDTAKLRGSLEAFSSNAQQAFARVLTARAANEDPFLPELELNEVAPGAAPPPTPAGSTPSLSTGVSARAPAARAAVSRTSPSFGEMLDAGSVRYELKPFTDPQPADSVLKYMRDNDLGSRDVEALLRGTQIVGFASDAERKTFLTEVDRYRKAKKLDEIANATAIDDAATKSAAARVFDRVSTEKDTQAGAVAEMTRVFTAQGFDAERTTAEVQALLNQSGGDAVAALGTLKDEILGTDAATSAARKALDHAGLLETILADGLIRNNDVVAEPELGVIIDPVRIPRPYDASLVILGGASVATVGNVTTTESVVIGANELVQLNA